LANEQQRSVEGLRKEDLLLNPPLGPAAAVPGLPSDPVPQANYTDLVLKGLNIGDDPDQVSFEAIKEAGGLGEIFGEERFKTPGVREVNAVLESLLGKTNNIQRAKPDVEELSSWQKGLLFVSDISAAVEGRMMPSLQLRDSLKRSITLQDQHNQEEFLKGTEALVKYSEALSQLPIEQRMRFAIQQSARLRRDFGEGFGANLISLAAEPTKADALEAFLGNVREGGLFEDGSADILTKYAAYLTGSGDVDEAQLVIREYLIGGKGNQGALEMDALYHAPALLEGKLDGFTAELRELGGDEARLAEKMMTGEQVSPSEIINANEKIALNSEFKLGNAVVRTLRVDPGRFAAVLPGMVNAEQQVEEQKAINDSERSLPVDFIGGPKSAKPGDIITAPGLGQKAAWAQANGYNTLAGSMDKLSGLGGGMTDANMIRLGADFEKESKSYGTLKAAFKVVREALAHDNPVGNLAAIFKFMKTLDEISVVREGEQKQAAGARSRLDALKTWVSRNISGETLTDTQKEQFLEVAMGIYGEAVYEQSLRVNRWVGRLDGLGVDRDRHGGIIVDFIGEDRSLFEAAPQGVIEEPQGALDRFQIN